MTSKIKNIGLGVICGIILALVALGIAGYSFYGKTVDNYQDEAEVIKTFIDDSTEPVVQKNYVLAGLNLSSDFQEYLMEGMEKGWWTEEYIIQVMLDDLIPVYKEQYKGTFELLLKSDKGQKLVKILDQIKPVLKSLNWEQIVGLISKLKAWSDTHDVQALIEQLQNLDLSQIKSSLISKIKEKLDNINLNIDLENIKATIIDKISDYIDGNVDIEKIKDKITTAIHDAVSDEIDNIDQEALEAKIIAAIKDYINENIDIGALKDEIVDIIKDYVNENIDGDEAKAKIIALIKDYVDENVDVEGIKDEIIAAIKEYVSENVDVEGIKDEIIVAIKEYVSENVDVEGIKDEIIATIKDYLIDNLLIDVIPDHHFDTDVVIGTHTISATFLNAFEIEIDEDSLTYDNNGTPANTSDDVLIINDIYVGFEYSFADETGGINILSGPREITVTGKNAFLLNKVIPKINDYI